MSSHHSAPTHLAWGNTRHTSPTSLSAGSIPPSTVKEMDSFSGSRLSTLKPRRVENAIHIPTSSLGDASSPDLIPKPAPDGGKDQAVQPPMATSRVGSDGEVRGKPESPTTWVWGSFYAQGGH